MVFKTLLTNEKLIPFWGRRWTGLCILWLGLMEGKKETESMVVNRIYWWDRKEITQVATSQLGQTNQLIWTVVMLYVCNAAAKCCLNVLNFLRRRAVNENNKKVQHHHTQAVSSSTWTMPGCTCSEWNLKLLMSALEHWSLLKQQCLPTRIHIFAHLIA